MGRWSRHPMGSDGALDARDDFMAFADTDGTYFFERPEEEIRSLLLDLSLDEIKSMANHGCTKNNKFVIPYTFIEYKALTKDPEIRSYLKDCLDSHDDITGKWNYCSEKTKNGEIVELAHINLFRENFDDIFDGKKELESDPGLLAAIESSNGDGLINKL